MIWTLSGLCPQNIKSMSNNGTNWAFGPMRALTSEAASTGSGALVVQGAAQRREQLESKKAFHAGSELHLCILPIVFVAFPANSDGNWQHVSIARANRCCPARRPTLQTAQLRLLVRIHVLLKPWARAHHPVR